MIIYMIDNEIFKRAEVHFSAKDIAKRFGTKYDYWNCNIEEWASALLDEAIEMIANMYGNEWLELNYRVTVYPNKENDQSGCILIEDGKFFANEKDNTVAWSDKNLARLMEALMKE